MVCMTANEKDEPNDHYLQAQNSLYDMTLNLNLTVTQRPKRAKIGFQKTQDLGDLMNDILMDDGKVSRFDGAGKEDQPNDQ
jgi:hypothetical protein